MKFDMSRAWNDATNMLTANREVVLALAGVFFFLPGLAAALMLPDMERSLPLDNETALREFIVNFYASYAPVLLVSMLIQLVGTITLLALLRDDSKPTVGEALKTGAFGLLPYIGVYLLLFIATFIVGMVLVGIPAAAGRPGVAIALMVLAVPVLVYVGVKLSLVTPVIAIEKVMNPIAIVQRSWQLTKGNSFRLFFYYFLLGLVYVIASIIISAVASMLSVILGAGTPAHIGTGILTALVGAAATAVFTVVIAAVHRQLAGPSTGSLNQTFG